MSTDLEKKIDRLIDAINGNNFDSGKARATTNLGTDGLGLIAENLGKAFGFAAGEVGKFAGKAIDNNATVSDATEIVSRSLSKFGLAGGLAGDALSGMTSVIMNVVDNWQKFSDVGLQFGANAGAFNDAVKKTGLSFSDYASILDQTKPAFANFGQGLTTGAEMFGEASNAILNNPTLQRSFNLLGMNAKEVNTALATVVRGAGMIDTNNKESMDKLLKSALSLAREMDIMAKLTGVSRKEQEKNIETMQQDVQTRALLSKLRDEDPERAKNIGAFQNNMGIVDPEIRKLFSESIATGGVLTQESIIQFGEVFGAKAIGFVEQYGRIMKSGTEDEQQQAIKDAKNIMPMLVEERKANRDMVISNRSIATDNPFAKIAYGDPMEILSKNLAKYQKEFGMEEGTRMARKEAENLGGGILNKDLIGPDGKPIAKAGEDDPRAKTIEIVTGVNSEIKRFGTALNEIIGQMNSTLTTQKDANNEFKATKIANEVAGYNKAGGARIKDIADAIKVEISILGGNPDKFVDTLAARIEKIVKGEPRAVGSKAATGSWLESGPKNILMGEGGEKEAVVPESSINEFFNDMLSSGLTSSQSTKASSPSLNGILRNISSKVSSAQSAEPGIANQIDSTLPSQDPVLEKLDKISTIMERVALHSERTERHVSDTASNTKDMGGYIG